MITLMAGTLHEILDAPHEMFAMDQRGACGALTDGPYKVILMTFYFLNPSLINEEGDPRGFFYYIQSEKITS